MLAAAAAYALFALLAIVGPGLALQRLARVKTDPALVAPLGLAACAAAQWLALTLHPLAFFALLGALDLVVLAAPRRLRRAEGPSLRGALPPLVALLALFAATEFPRNRSGERGEFAFCSVVPEDMAFHAGLAWELTVSYPPQVPGLSGVPMGYHNGLPLVRAAAARWAGVAPLDQMSRFEIALMALALVLALRGVAARLGGTPLAVALAGFTPVAADFSFLIGAGRWREAWLYLTDSNLVFSLVHANSSVAATLIAVAALIGLDRHLRGEGRGFLLLAAALSLAVPQFKAFVAAHLIFGLAVAALLTRRVREAALLAVPALVALAAIVLGRASAQMEIVVDPLAIVTRLMTNLGIASGPLPLALWTLLWLGASLGLRIVGLPTAFGALLSASLPASALAAMALSGWPIGLLFRVMPLDYAGWRPPYNEAWYFIEQSAPLLWIFAALALGRLRPAGVRAAAAAAVVAALTLPSTVQFAWVHRAAPPALAPPAVVEAMAALAAASRPGEVVLQRPEPKRFPPPPLVLIGRRVPFTRFIPYLYQVAPRAELIARIEQVRLFFKSDDPDAARQIARSLGARWVVLYGDDTLGFPVEGVLRPVFERPNVKVYEVLGVPRTD